MKIRKLVILAAGMGTRFLPITKGVSKEMLPLYDKPAIQYLVDEAKLCGIEEIFIVIANKREALKHYFEKDEVLEQRLLETNKLDFLNIVKDVSSVKVTYIMQEEALGSGYALSLAKPYVGDEDFAVMYCDDIVKGVPALKEVIDVYNNTGNNVMAAVSVRHEDTYKYGILEIDKNMKVISLVEKPKVEEAPSNLASIGRLILKKDIFDKLSKIDKVKGEYYLTSALEMCINEGTMSACKISGTYFDTGNKLGYMKASIAYDCDNLEYKEEIKKFVNNL